jgi:hypothetical protein
LNEPASEDPRCPLVPNVTRCVASSGSGRREKYALVSARGSINTSRGAGLPARGEVVMASRRGPTL